MSHVEDGQFVWSDSSSARLACRHDSLISTIGRQYGRSSARMLAPFRDSPARAERGAWTRRSPNSD